MSNLLPLDFAEAYSKKIVESLPLAMYFGDMYASSNNTMYTTSGLNTIHMPLIEVTGRVNGDLDNPVASTRRFGSTYKTYVIENHRVWNTPIHPLQIDFTNSVASIVNILNEFNVNQKFPEMQARLVSKLYADWVALGNTARTEELTSSNILLHFDEMMCEMSEDMVPEAGRVLYVTPPVNALLKHADALQRNFDVQVSNGSVSRLVTALDDVKIVVVPSALMNTIYDFTVGYKVDTSASRVNMILAHNIGIITPVLYDQSYLDSPDAHASGRYMYHEESYDDVFIMPNRDTCFKFHISAVDSSGA